MDMSDFFANVETTFLAKFNESAIVTHPGDKGENREEILSEFLATHLPKRYGITKGQVVTRHGLISPSIDIIIYDALNCPILYSGRTAIVPVEGVYGIIEVKSKLSKAKLLEGMRNIKAFKELAPQDLGITQREGSFTMRRASRPFGAVFAFGLSDNSAESLAANFLEEHTKIHNVNFFTNMVCVLGSGALLHYSKIDLDRGERTPLLDTDEFVNLTLLVHKRAATDEPTPEILLEMVPQSLGDKAFGRFFVFILIMLEHLMLNVPDLGRYVDPSLPALVSRKG